jgi:hypothetical protein
MLFATCQKTPCAMIQTGPGKMILAKFKNIRTKLGKITYTRTKATNSRTTHQMIPTRQIFKHPNSAGGYVMICKYDRCASPLNTQMETMAG